MPHAQGALINQPDSFKESDIRPDDLMQGQAERYARDIARMMKRKAEFVESACPACAATENTHTFKKYDLNYVTCTQCETMYVSPRPSPAVLDDYYSNSENYEYWNKYIFPASESTRREKIFRPRAERVLKICREHAIAPHCLVEVGSGFGTFCQEIISSSFFKRVIAVEPTPSLAETCRKKGIEVIEKPIEQVDLQTEVNVIANFEVIEHLFSPEDFLRNCLKVLSPGGLFVLTCPNVKGFDILTLGSVSNTVDTEHLNYFHPASISLLLQRCGFQVLDISTPGRLDAELVHKKVSNGEFTLKDPFLKEVLIKRWQELGLAFQDFLAEHALSSNMWVIAKKP